MSTSVRRQLCSIGLVVGLVAVVVVSHARAESVRITLLHFNDAYEIKPRPGALGGLARVAALRAELRKNNPKRTFTILAGDALSPSALGMVDVDGEKLAGRQMIASLRAVGVDFATFGNHEFDLKFDQFTARLRESELRLPLGVGGTGSRIYWFSDNVSDASDSPFPGVIQSLVLHVQGDHGTTVKVGLLGLTTNSNQPGYVKFRDPIDAARKQVRQWREDRSCDLILAVTHQTIEEDERLAMSVPEISLILGGHEHENSYTHRSGLAHPPIAKADANTKTVYVHDLTFDTDCRRLRIDSRLEPILPDLPEDADAARVINDWYDRGTAAFEAEFKYKPGDLVFVSPQNLEGRDNLVRSGRTNLTRLITDSMLQAAGSEAAILNSGTIRLDDVIPAGPITYYDIHQILPYSGTIISAQIYGELLKKILDRGAAIPQDGGFLQTANIEGNSVTGWIIKGTPLNPSTQYTISGTSYMMGGLEKKYADLDLGANPQITERKDVGAQREALIRYLKTQPAVDAPESSEVTVKEIIRHEPILTTVP